MFVLYKVVTYLYFIHFFPLCTCKTPIIPIIFSFQSEFSFFLNHQSNQLVFVTSFSYYSCTPRRNNQANLSDVKSKAGYPILVSFWRSGVSQIPALSVYCQGSPSHRSNEKALFQYVMTFLNYGNIYQTWAWPFCYYQPWLDRYRNEKYMKFEILYAKV